MTNSFDDSYNFGAWPHFIVFYLCCINDAHLFGLVVSEHLSETMTWARNTFIYFIDEI